jgi:hypothetical protein
VSAIRDPLADHLVTPPQRGADRHRPSPGRLLRRRAGLEHVTLAGGRPVRWVALGCDLQRDWAHLETVEAVVQILLTDRPLKE